MKLKEIKEIKKATKEFLEIIRQAETRAIENPTWEKDSIAYSKEAGQLRRSFLTLKYKIIRLL